MGSVRYDRRTRQTRMQMTITNTSQTDINGPVWVLVKAISNPNVALVDSDGTAADGC